MYFVVLIFVLYLSVTDGNITLKAKFMGNTKVEGDSYSVYALSVPHCLAICNKNRSCDAITFNDEMKKCRLFKRCVPVEIIGHNSHHWFYAKRPPVSDNGYFYEESSDTCLKLTDEQLPHHLADEMCSKDKGYLAVLYTPELRKLAVKMLQNSRITDAWINPPFKMYEKYAKNGFRKKRRVDSVEYADNEAESNDCWLMKNSTVMRQPFCENVKRFSICQLPTY